METSSTLHPEDLDFSGSVKEGTNKARVRDYIHSHDKATHCCCQNSRSGVTHVRLRESLSVLFLVLISCDVSLNMASFLSSQLEPHMLEKLKAEFET